MSDKIKSLIDFNEIEQSAQSQIYNIEKFNFCEKIVVLPDVHAGYLIPVGSAVLFDSVISPYAVGQDIGCGMCCLVTDIPVKDLGNKRSKLKLFNQIKSTIPAGLGVNRTSTKTDYKEFESASGDKNLSKSVTSDIFNQIGTLGSGNHFQELGVNEQDKLVITIHSGSRHAGYTLADWYINFAKWNDIDLPQFALSFMSDAGQMYFSDMNKMIEFAYDNRICMMEEICNIIGINKKFMIDNIINESHNHAIIYGNKNDHKILHRKGATDASIGHLGVIPGSMNTGTYITKGLGNEEYLKSASHGAGRKLSRKKAKLLCDIDQFKKDMKGIISIVGKSTADENPRAYKDLHHVIELQKDIVVEVISYVKPLINIKGT